MSTGPSPSSTDPEARDDLGPRGCGCLFGLVIFMVLVNLTSAVCDRANGPHGIALVNGATGFTFDPD